ncbi:MAG: hypothetical protein M1817_003070 [Caeruleum heppii]|nr:MAG: hypothetical protein M1817_003070 [Caeruleum heppii]
MDRNLFNPSDSPSHSQRFRSPLPPSPMQTAYRLDEGYSEETRSQPGSDTALRSPLRSPLSSMYAADANAVGLPAWVATLDDTERVELAYAVLRTLRTSSIQAIIERLHPLLHLDPVRHLPPELIFHILSYLDPSSLLVASTVSQAWRSKALDSRLWYRVFKREGWSADVREVLNAEEAASAQKSSPMTAPRTRRRELRATSRTETEPSPKRRAAHRGLFGGGMHTPAATSERTGSVSWETQHNMVDAEEREQPDPPAHLREDESMEDVDGGMADSVLRPSSSDAGDPGSEHLARPTLESLTRSELFLPSCQGQRKLDWHYLYKQRRRLEDNWTAGRFVNFQLPHPDHEYEAHGECIYTIQYCGKYLVSGSRDKSLRLWDLDTRRLVRKPLYGHTGSVLCLQFDASEEEDLIVSGSSDTDVIIWRFSTGEMIKKIRHAHKESVLNLRFDKRYLVTCSKDKTINVWNRRALAATDKEFPSDALTNRTGTGCFPNYVLNMAAANSPLAEAQLSNRPRPPPIPPYSLLMTLRGHCAAVNAIQVYGNQVVSASGDRTIKVFKLNSGHCVRSIAGHSKGIACVQFDGRRIVSGSSDNTVKIFDRKTGAEVACLTGHQYLVRTVQAAFGDIPGSEEDDAAEARRIDMSIFDNTSYPPIDSSVTPFPQDRGLVNTIAVWDQKDVTSYGASLPPGGGGSRWARIVSGSYDETVIIWKRDAAGKWIIGHKLKQEDAAKRASRRTTATAVSEGLQAMNAAARALAARPSTAQAQPTPAGNGAPQGHITATMNAQIHPMLSWGSAWTSGNAFNQSDPQQAQPQQGHPGSQPHSPSANPSTPPAPTTATTPPPSTWPAVNFPSTLPVHAPHLAPLHPLTSEPPPLVPIPFHHGDPTPYTGHAPPHALAPVHPDPAATANANANANANPNPGNARVFKLQFDARRIICCSQDPKIVGWDFANGDRTLEEAARFFEVLG